MSERDIVTWNAMIGGYSQRRLYDECKRLYLEMLNVSGVAPNAVTAVSVMQACGQSMDLVFGMELHRFVKESGIEIDISLSNSVVAMYAKCGRLDYTRELFEGMREKDEVTYGAMISGYMDYGFVDEPMCVFRGVENPGLNMWNAVISGMVQNKEFEAWNIFKACAHSGMCTLTSVLAACAHSGFVDEAWNIFNLMPSKYGIQPLVEHYACMVGVLS
ncbi:hypothetical protein GLYMA_10G047150v4 [Glycine max]|nr:hypothetical protein GLYMA_10G047150v4 [Glycine max]